MKLNTIKQRFNFEARAEQNEKRDILSDNLFLSNVENIKCYIDLLRHVQVNKKKILDSWI